MENIQNLYPPPYSIIDGCLFRETSNGKKMIQKKLCNFLPYLKSEITIDDGAEVKKYYKIAGVHASGALLSSVLVSVADFAAMNWIATNWGSRCNIEAGNSTKDYIRHAIQTTAVDIEEHIIYKHLGWRKVNNEWHYLIPNNNCFDVSLEGKLANYQFKESCTIKDVQASYKLISSGLVSDEVSFSLLGMMYLSPLNESLKQAGHEPKAVLALTGKTGSKKSSLTALFLSHFGLFTHDSLPLSFRDTANSILARLFLLKDVPTVIDDLHPGIKKEESQMAATAQMIMRAFGDKTARGRMRSDLSIADPRPPRGNGIITAEFSPDISESGTARYLNLELKENSVNMDILTEMQQLAEEGCFRGAMKGYTDFLKDNYLSTEKEFIKELHTLFVDTRKMFRSELCSGRQYYHDRIPEACAWLYIGLHFAMKYFISYAVVSDKDAEDLLLFFCWHLISIAEKQIDSVQHDKPTEKFLLKLFSLLDSGSVVLFDKNNPPDAYFSNVVGYRDENYIYIIADAAHKSVKRLCDEQGESFSINSKSLLAELDSEGLLEKASNGERTKTLRILNNYKRVAYLYKDKVAQVLGRPV